MRRVVKIGGSLLLQPGLRTSINRWLAAQPPAQTLVIVGGGDLINAVRELDRAQPGLPADIHWLCVDLLRVTFQFTRDFFDHWNVIDSAADLQRAIHDGSDSDQPALVSASVFYRPDNDYGLPHDWSTTTDAIAAALAVETVSDELVLLKSCLVDQSLSIQQLADTKVVDTALPLIADRVKSIRVESLS